MEGNSLIGEGIGLLTSPVTTFKKRAEEKNIKKEAIIALVVVVVIALVTLLNIYITATKSVNAVYKSYKKYSEKYSYLNITKEEYKKEKKEAKKFILDNVKFGEAFLKTGIYTLIAMGVIAGIQYVISRLVKSPKDFIDLLSFTNSAFVIIAVGYVVGVLLSIVYTPFGYILYSAAFIFAMLALANSFRESMQVEDTNKLVICSTIVITVVIAVLVFIANKYIGDLFSSL